MKASFHFLGRVALPAAMLAPAQVTLVQGAEAPVDRGHLDPLEVTAEATEIDQDEVSSVRTGTALIDVPQSVSVFDQEQIKEQGIDSIGGIVDYTPGVINSQGEGHRDAVSFRGQARSTADFFVDGIRDDVQYYRALYNVEQVEILRGPNALFFGRGGTGGVINRVLKKAYIGDDFGEIGGTVNSFGGYYGDFDYNKSLNDQLAFRLNLFYEHLENHRDFFDGERFGVNPTLRWSPSEGTTVDFAYEYIDHERFIDRGVPASGFTVFGREKPASFLSGITFGDSELNETSIEGHTLRTTVNHRFSDNWRASATAFYGTYDKAYTNFFPTGYDPGTNLVTIDGYSDRTDRQNFNLAGDVIGEFSTGSLEHKVLIGGEYIRTSSDQNRYNNVWGSNGSDKQSFTATPFRMSNGLVFGPGGTIVDSGAFSDLNDDTRVTIDSYSFFLQDEIALNNCLDLVLGARFDSFDIDVFDAKNGVSRSRRDDEVTPRVGLVYKPFHSTSFYASYSESFLPRSGEQFANINPPNDALAPDEFTNFEVGVKWDICNDLILPLAGFQIEHSSPQPANVPGTLDVIDTETLGFEAQLQGRLMDHWYILAGYTFLDGEVVAANGAATSRIPREQPEHSFSVWNSFPITE